MPSFLNIVILYFLILKAFTCILTKAATNIAQINTMTVTITKTIMYLRTFARKFSSIDFFLKILPLKDDDLVMSEM